MLSIKSFSAGKSAAGIAQYVQQTGAEKYYGDGYWGGEGAKAMNLEGTLNEGELENYLAGRDPKSGEPITSKVDREHKPGWDLTYSAPKSVSVIWAADPSQRGAITTAHEKAVAAAMDYLEKDAFFTRHGKDGIEHQAVLAHGGLVYSVHHHAATRANDPGLHSHVVVGNLTPDGRSVDFDTRHKMVAGALYRTELAHQMKQLGFEINRDDKSFKIVGVDQELCDLWSKRSDEIRAEMQEQGVTSAAAAAEIAADSRHAKSGESEVEAFKRWEAEAKEQGYSTEKVLETGLREAKNALVLQAPKDVLGDLLINNSTVSQLQLKAASIVASQGHHNAEKALEHYNNITLKDKDTVWLASENGARATNQETIDRETQMLARAEHLASMNTHTVDPQHILKSDRWPTLTQPQKEAVAHLTDGGDLVLLQGWAGTGKTYTLSVAIEAWKSAGYTVVVTAPSNRAVSVLRHETGVENIYNTTTLQIKMEVGKLKLDSKTVIVIDEAAMEGSNRIAWLLEKVQESGAKIVMQGDTKQLQAVAAGAPMRGIMEKVGAIELGREAVIRQQSEIDKEIACDIREGRTHDAFSKLEANGKIKSYEDSREVHKAAAKSYLNDIQKGKTSILVAYTRNEVRYLNEHVREHLKSIGTIEKAGEVVRTASGKREFCKGDTIMFGEKNRFDKTLDSAVHNGSRGTIENIKDGVLHIKLEDSSNTIRLDIREYDKIDHGHAGTVHKAQAASVDTTHLVVGDRGSQEWGYVGASRHREELSIHATKDAIAREKEAASDIEKAFAHSEAKDLSTDYLPLSPEPPEVELNKDEPTPSAENVKGEAEAQKEIIVPLSDKASNQLPPENKEQPVKDANLPNLEAKGQPARSLDSEKPIEANKDLGNTKNETLAKSESSKSSEITPVTPKTKETASKIENVAKPNLQQAKENQKRLSHSIKEKAQEVVRKVETVQLAIEKSSKSEGLGL